MRRVTLRAEALSGVELRPAQDIELLLSEPSGRRVKRRYTIRNHRRDIGEVDVDVFLHGQSPGSVWGSTALPGDEVSFQGPRGKLTVTSAPWHILVGDESALPAIGAICESLPEDEPAIAVIEVGDAEDELPVIATTHWIHRASTPPGTPQTLVTALAGLELPPGSGHGYLMGETRSMVAVRALLEERGLTHDNIFLKGYWNIARPDRIAGQRPKNSE
jgi:NADPH-dependent ferric siderophore reductase